MVTIGHNGIPMPWLDKFQRLQSRSCELFINGGKFIEKIDLAHKDIYRFNESFPAFQKIEERKFSKWSFMAHCLSRNMLSLPKIKRIVKNFDVIYSPSSVLDLILIPFLAKLYSRKIKWVTVFDNIVPFSDPGNKVIRFLGWLFFQISLIFVKKADTIFVSTPGLMDFLLKKGFDEKKLVQTNFAIEVEMAKKAMPDKKYNIDALFMGRINETKGIYDMLKVLAIVKKKYPNFQLAIMGEGDDTTKNKFKTKILEMSLRDNVQFLGFRQGLEKYNIINSAKCFWFLSVSKSESFGIALLEAVSLGLPAFAYDLPQFPRIYQNGEIDISPKGNWGLVAEKVLKLFERGDFINEKGKLLLGKYSWENIAKIEYGAIEGLISKK